MNTFVIEPISKMVSGVASGPPRLVRPHVANDLPSGVSRPTTAPSPASLHRSALPWPPVMDRGPPALWASTCAMTTSVSARIGATNPFLFMTLP